MIKLSEGFMDQIKPYIPHLLGGAGVGALGNLMFGDEDTPWYQRMLMGGLGGAAAGGLGGYGWNRYGDQIKNWWNSQGQQPAQQPAAPTADPREAQKQQVQQSAAVGNPTKAQTQEAVADRTAQASAAAQANAVAQSPEAAGELAGVPQTPAQPRKPAQTVDAPVVTPAAPAANRAGSVKSKNPVPLDMGRNTHPDIPLNFGSGSNTHPDIPLNVGSDQW